MIKSLYSWQLRKNTWYINFLRILFIYEKKKYFSKIMSNFMTRCDLCSVAMKLLSYIYVLTLKKCPVHNQRNKIKANKRHSFNLSVLWLKKHGLSFYAYCINGEYLEQFYYKVENLISVIISFYNMHLLPQTYTISWELHWPER